jgi:hypothetical protein
MKGMEYFVISHIVREENSRANALAQHASGYDVRHGRLEIRYRPAIYDVLAIQEDGKGSVEVSVQVENDWREALIKYISDPSSSHDRKIR